MKWTLISQGGKGNASLGQAINSACKGLDLDRLDVAVAYATLPGVKALKLALGGIPKKSRWVIGLDDAITQPEALKYLVELPGSEVRVAKMTPAKRFHPKLYCLWSSLVVDRCISVIGSGNMTLNGLRTNGETAIILTAETSNEVENLRTQWDKMWELGHKPNKKELDDYRGVYLKAKNQRKKLVDLGVTPPEAEPDAPVDEEPAYDGDPAAARIAWLEAGSPSAAGRDLEFPKAMMPFFALNKSKEARNFIMENGSKHSLTFTERTDNQMWRLLFSSASIQDALGRDTMRPTSGGNRSDLVVAFHKIEGSKDFKVKMMTVNSVSFKDLVKKSKEVKGVFSTRNPGGRQFGFY